MLAAEYRNAVPVPSATSVGTATIYRPSGNGTDEPWEVGQYASHGCVRLTNAQISALFPLVQAGTLEQAVRRAFQNAKPGEVVLLAPACASFDQFHNYEHRGRFFKQQVRQLEEEFAAGERARAS